MFFHVQWVYLIEAVTSSSDTTAEVLNAFAFLKLLSFFPF